MSRLLTKVDGWEKAYEAFQQVNFTAFDYNTVKQSMIDYVKTYFPSSFNDYIESSEFIAILETFAYLTEIMAYRVDINAHENFIGTAQRKESILRMAKLISYTSSRNMPARGLVKITSINTTESVFDSNNTNLAGVTIKWNDPDNTNWREQFILVMNQLILQEFGTVNPNDRVQVDDVLFELYTAGNSKILHGVIKYDAIAGGETIPMELVSSSLDQYGPYETRPNDDAKFKLLYGSDGLGDDSETTGFFMFTKQGSLSKLTTSFDGVTPNITFDVNIDNINDIDLWVNNVDTNGIIDDGTILNGLSGEWNPVNTSNGQNIAFNIETNVHKYEIENLTDDNVRLIFGDGQLSEIPNGDFDIWYRSSINGAVSVQKGSVVNTIGTIPYVDNNNNPQTTTFTFSLINSLQNGDISETLEHVRRVASSVYNTQDRMVNDGDYDSFMLQDPSILKISASNRTLGGDAKYIPSHDPSGTYENIKLFATDGVLYIKDVEVISNIFNNFDGDELLTNVIEPLLSNTHVYVKQREIANNQGFIAQPSRSFNQQERYLILEAMGVPTDYNINPIVGTFPIGLSFDVNGWTPNNPVLAGSIFEIDQIIQGSSFAGWEIKTNGSRMLIHSNSTNFWTHNDGKSVMDSDTKTPNRDVIIILKTNADGKNRECSLLEDDVSLFIDGAEVISNGLADAGLPYLKEFRVIPQLIDTRETEARILLDPEFGELNTVTKIEFDGDNTIVGTSVTVNTTFDVDVVAGPPPPPGDGNPIPPDENAPTGGPGGLLVPFGGGPGGP